MTQVSRLGNPLVNELVIGIKDKVIEFSCCSDSFSVNSELMVLESVFTLRGLDCPRPARFFTMADTISSVEVAVDILTTGISARSRSR